MEKYNILNSTLWLAFTVVLLKIFEPVHVIFNNVAFWHV